MRIFLTKHFVDCKLFKTLHKFKSKLSQIFFMQHLFPGILFNKNLLILLASIFIFGCQTSKKMIQYTDQLSIQSKQITAVKSSIRALEVVNDKTAWFAGSGGVFGYTEDSGQSWVIDSLGTPDNRPHFRAISVTSKAVFLLSIASPALLYKSTDKGNNWTLVHQDNHPEIFYDAMTFWNDNEGIAMGDPTDGCLSILITRDGGDNWKKVDCSKLPATIEGEAAFAASNSNISIQGDQAWVVSGGNQSRVFHTADKGHSWNVYDTPIVSGGKMTGIFTSHFYDDKQGIVFGGNWETKTDNTKNKAVTKDGGRSWQLIADGSPPGYRSSVRYFPKGGGNALLAVGIPGISYSWDGGATWKLLDDESFYICRFSGTGRTVWVAGDKKIGRLLF